MNRRLFSADGPHRLALLAVALGTVMLASPSLLAQAGPPPGGQGAPPAGAPRLNGPQRVQMERRLQERINQVVRKRLALTDSQFFKLRDVASRVEEDRRTLRNEEMTTRFAMRQELMAGEKANEAKVGELLDQMPKFERRRLELMEREQRELAKFLSPSQRARYLGLQDELRRSMQDVQRRRMGLDGEPPENAPAGAPRRLRRPPGTPN